nr:MAG TPA: hypothetical protein [Caudoviricetes sp.]
MRGASPCSTLTSWTSSLAQAWPPGGWCRRAGSRLAPSTTGARLPQRGRPTSQGANAGPSRPSHPTLRNGARPPWSG